jgi:hypothetical protein
MLLMVCVDGPKGLGAKAKDVWQLERRYGMVLMESNNKVLPIIWLKKTCLPI